MEATLRSHRELGEAARRELRRQQWSAWLSSCLGPIGQLAWQVANEPDPTRWTRTSASRSSSMRLSATERFLPSCRIPLRRAASRLTGNGPLRRLFRGCV